jgi:plastocyanin
VAQTPDEGRTVGPHTADRQPRRRAVALVAVLSLALAGCGDGDGGVDDTDAPGETAATIAIVDEDGFGFEPAEVTVAADGTVTWSHEGSVAHTVTAEDGSFDSGSLSGGDTFEETFEDAGGYAYVCSFHPGMQGTVTVE